MRQPENRDRDFFRSNYLPYPRVRSLGENNRKHTNIPIESRNVYIYIIRDRTRTSTSTGTRKLAKPYLLSITLQSGRTYTAVPVRGGVT